jgi:ribosomal protein S14
MISSKIKDLKIRKSFYKLESKNKIKKFIFTNILNKKKSVINVSTDETQLKSISFYTFKFANKGNHTSKIKLTRRCIFNNRSRGVIRPLGISRTYLRELMHFGLIPGYKKAVW